MVDLSPVVRSLKIERSRVASELKSLDRAISALAWLDAGKPIRVRASRHAISPAARRRIVAAQKARWAKWRAQRAKRK